MIVNWILLLALCLSVEGRVADSSSQALLDFRPPARLGIPMRTRPVQKNNGAPPEPYPRAFSALVLPQIKEIEPDLASILDDIREGMQYVFQTKNDFTFPIHGTGTFGMGAVLDNLIEPEDKVLVMSIGYWGDLMANMSERLGANVVKCTGRPERGLHLLEIEAALQIHQPNILAIVMGESDTGVRQPMDGIGELARRYNALLVVDVVSVSGMQPVMMDKMKMDAIFASSAKGIGAAAGLAPVSLSSRALEKLRNRVTLPRAFQTDLLVQSVMWNTTHRQFIQTLSLPLIYSLREALATIAEEGLENGFKRYESATEQLEAGLEALGCHLYVPSPAYRMIGITTALPPTGKDIEKIIDFLFRNSNIAITGGYGPTEGKVLRIATFGINADSQRVTNVLIALEKALQSPETDI